MAMKQFDIVRATFAPRRTDDLKACADDFVGRELNWEAAWIIEDGPYIGEWAMMPMRMNEVITPFAWVPSGDLIIKDIFNER